MNDDDDDDDDGHDILFSILNHQHGPFIFTDYYYFFS